MRRYPWALGGALVFALISAGSLGAGIVGLKPVLDLVLGANPRDLPMLAGDANTRLAEWSTRWGVPMPRISDGVIAALPAGPFTAAVWIFIALGLLTVLGAIANFLHAYLSLTVVNRAVTAIRREAFHRTIRQPLRDIVATGPSDAISRVIVDTYTLAGGFNALLSKALAQLTKGLAAGVAALVIDWRLTGAALLTAPILYTVIRKLGKRIRRASRAALETQAELYRAAGESLQGLRVVKVHTTERYEAGRFHRANKRMLREMNRVRTARALASPLIEVLAIVVVGGLALVAIRAILANHLDPGRFVLALGALGMAGGSLKPLTGIINDIQQSAASADRLAELMAKPPEPGHGVALAKLGRHAQSLEFRGVALTYPGQERPAVDGVDLTIAHGQTVAFVGPNGCGKTSLLSLVPRLFEPERGAVLIDGQDIREFSVRSLRRQIGVVTQETVLFSGTIRGNIAYGAEHVTDEKILAAARKARAHEFIERLPQGYDTPVAEQGASLSGGQRQRIAIARAILRDPAILILDEATSMVDAESEGMIAEAVGEFSRGRTCLIVAHRLSTVLAADSIVVMDKGRIVDRGTHTELLGRCAVYQRLARTQLVGDGQ